MVYKSGTEYKLVYDKIKINSNVIMRQFNKASFVFLYCNMVTYILLEKEF